jgi:hypothetical protein
MPRAAALVSLLLLVRPAAAASIVTEFSTGGCLCLTTCERTIDSPIDPWCITSYNSSATCGSFSASRGAFWQTCTVGARTETTASSANPLFFPLKTFRAVFVYVMVTCVGTVAAVYGAAGALAARGSSTPLKVLLWAPAAGAVLGALHGLVVGAPFAALLAFFYMALPYAIDVSVAISLGLALAGIAVFFACSKDGLRTEML